MSLIKVIQIHQSLNMGGIETMIVQLSNHIDKNRYSVVVCSLSADVPKASELNTNVEFFSLGYPTTQLRGFQLVFHFYSILKKMGKLLNHVRPDVVHVHSYFTIYFLVSLAVRFYAKHSVVIKTVHTSGLFYSSDTLMKRFRVRVEQLATLLNNTYVVGISEQVYDRCKQLFLKQSKNVFLIHNGVDLALFDISINEKLRNELICGKKLLAVYVARFDDGKNHDFLLYIWKQLRDCGLDKAKLLFVGDGLHFNRIKKMIIKEKLTDIVYCLGRSNEIPEILSVSDFALFPSDYEGFSLSLIEKMAAGLPVIASDIPPFKEVITDGINGFTLAVNDVCAWKTVITMMVENKENRLKIGKAARERSRDFSVERMVKKYENLYAEKCRL